MLSVFGIVAFLLLGLHFGIPLAYYLNAKLRWLNKPWKIEMDEEYRPNVSILLPTYNEAKIIEERLDNLSQQKYPEELMEIIVIDSASKDETPELVEKWTEGRNIQLKLVEEEKRRGKFPALKKGLEELSRKSEIVVFTDADAFWRPYALKNAVKYLSDPSVGSVTASMGYTHEESIEETYRGYYNSLRIAESKIHSTPVHNGPFLAMKTKLLRKYGLPEYPGSDDSAFGSFMAFLGHRAIQVEDVKVKEPVGETHSRKLRRAQHLLLSFLNTKEIAKEKEHYKKSSFDRIWRMEWWLHLGNPWLLLVGVGFLLGSLIVFKSLIVGGVLVVGLLLFLSKSFRTWIFQQVYLLVAALKNFWTKEAELAVWEK